MSLLIAAAFLALGQADPPPLTVAEPPPVLAEADADALRPRWAVRPQPDYPIRALMQGTPGGEAILACTTAPEGRLADCTVVFETPAGLGFAEEALRAVAAARVHGEAGQSVRFRVAFILAE